MLLSSVYLLADLVPAATCQIDAPGVGAPPEPAEVAPWRHAALPACSCHLSGDAGECTDNGLDESTLRCSTSAQCAAAMK